jgi:AcrR family transcriptional regulator
MEYEEGYSYHERMATGHDSRPIWALPQPAERKPRYTREQIADTALRIADQEGFNAVTMKRIAAELGAGTMTVYYYVRNKTDIVALMQDSILADVLIPAEELPAHWREAIAAIARRTRHVLLAHPWSLTSLNDAQFGPNAMRHIEQSLAVMAATGLPAQARLEIITTVDDLVFGNALRTIESLTRAADAEANPAMTAAMIEYGVAQLKAGEFPELTAIYAESTARPADEIGPPMTDNALASEFERGLASLLDGIAARMNLD